MSSPMSNQSSLQESDLILYTVPLAGEVTDEGGEEEDAKVAEDAGDDAPVADDDGGEIGGDGGETGAWVEGTWDCWVMVLRLVEGRGHGAVIVGDVT